MEIELPPGTPDNVKMAFDESVRILADATKEGNLKADKYRKLKKRRELLGYILLGSSLIASVLITANLLPHQLAIAIAIIFAIDRTFSNSRRVVALAQAEQAFSRSVALMATTGQTEQAKIFSAEPDKVEMIKKITALNIRLAEEVHERFATAETAIGQSDIETLQALALDQDKLNTAMKHFQQSPRSVR